MGVGLIKNIGVRFGITINGNDIAFGLKGRGRRIGYDIHIYIALTVARR